MLYFPNFNIFNYRVISIFLSAPIKEAQRKKLRGGVILRLFSRLSKFFIALLSRKRAAKLRVSERVKACLHTKRTKAVSRSKTPAQRFTIQTKLCVPVALFSPLLSLRGKFGNGATRCARLPCNAASPALKQAPFFLLVCR